MSAVSTMTDVVPQRRVMSLQAPPRASSLRAEPKFGQYLLGQTLGEGEFGKVKLGWPCKRNGTKDDAQVAVKLIRREIIGSSTSRMNKIEREISVLRKVKHPNIVGCLEVVETEKYIGIILEYASGGELFDYILAHRYLKDPVAAKLFAQLISAVQYLHGEGIVHRDLKLENLLLDRNRNIIVTDFGFANTFDPCHSSLESSAVRTAKGDLMQTSCGSPCYAAPELVVSDGSYCGRKVDVWSCGVILYAMLSGYLPFDDDPLNPEGDDISLLYQYIVSTPLTFPEYVSPLSRDLLRRILVPDPEKRVHLGQVVNHSWLAAHTKILQVTPVVGTVPANPPETMEQMTAQDMIRSSSERAAAHTSFALPKANHLVPTGFAKNTSMSAPPPKSSTSRASKRHTVQIEYDAPSVFTTRESDVHDHLSSGKMIESQVETLSIPVAPSMARSVTHTGVDQKSQQPVTELSETGKSSGRATTKLPAPQRKPRPTSYHPAYRRPEEEEVALDRRIPSDPSDVQSIRLGSSGSTASRVRSGLPIPKTASPRSTKQNASGELYASGPMKDTPDISIVVDQQEANTLSSYHTRPTHKRNSSSVSSLLGKFWPMTFVQDTVATRRMSAIAPSTGLNSITETDTTVQHSAMKGQGYGYPEAAGEHSTASLYPAGKRSTSVDLEGKSRLREASVNPEPKLGKVMRTSGLKQKTAAISSDNAHHKTSTSAARRVMDFFTNRRKERT